MTLSEMKDEIARRSGIPRSVVANILDIQDELISDCVLQRETCYIGKVFVVRSRYRDFSVLNKDGIRHIVNRLAVTVKPRAPFRRRMNNGKVRSSD